jgi:hypothetical protein
VQLELPGLSASNRYTVSLFVPKARIVPSFPACLVVIGVAAAVLDEAPLVDWPYGPPLPAEEDVLAEVDGVLAGAEAALDLLLLPQPAIASATATGTTAAAPALYMGTSHRFRRRSLSQDVI